MALFLQLLGSRAAATSRAARKRPAPYIPYAPHTNMVAKKVATKSKATVATGKRTTQRAAAAKKAVGKAPTAAAGSSRGLSVAVFGGARPGNSQDYTAAASELGRQLALRNITLLYGGATVGCMGAVGRAVQENKPPGVARGFIPKKLADLNGSLAAVRTDNMTHNKAMLFGHCDAAIAMSGGIGTLEELSEFLSVRYLADTIGHTTAAGTYRMKPVALLNTRNFFKSYLQQLRHMVREGFVSEQHVDHIIVESDVTKLLNRLTAAVAADSNIAASKPTDPNHSFTCTH